MKKILIFAVLLLWGIVALSQQNIRGIITDAITREPLENAVVKVKNNNGSAAFSNLNGEFIVDIKSETDSLIISYIGHETIQIIANILKISNSISLKPSLINLKEVVINGNLGTKFNTIGKIDLNTRPVKSSQEILGLVPGLFIAQHQGGGKAEQIFLRGFDIDHGTDINISVDGLPVNMVSHAHGQGYADLHFIIPELVKNIDYGTGPYYTQYGNMGVAGYVNLSTVNSLPNNTVKAELGQFNTYRVLAMINLLSKKAKESNKNFYMAGEYQYSDGPFKSPQHFNRKNFFSKYSSPIGSNSFLTILASTFSSKWNASGQIPERTLKAGLIGRFGAIDDTEGGNTGRTNISGTFKTKLNTNSTWTDLFYYSHYDFDLFSNFTFFLNNPVDGDQIRQREKRNILGYTGTYNLQKQWSNWNSKTIATIGVRQDFIKGSELSNTKNKALVLERLQWGNIKENNTFAYLDQTFSNNKWALNFGSRIDYFQFVYKDKLIDNNTAFNRKRVISPKININYTINNKTQLYFKAGKGFHSNDTRLVIDRSATSILPAAYGTDIGVLLKPFSNLIINAAVWYLYLQQELVYVGDEGIVEPSGKSRRMGIDLSARYKLSRRLFADMNINLTTPRSIEAAKGENYIPLAPTFTSIGGLNVQFKKGWNGNIRYRYMKDRPANEKNRVIASGYTIIDANINYTKKKYEAGLVIENLFNAKWNEAQFNTKSRLKDEPAAVEEIHFTPGNPFNIRFKLAMFF